MLMKDLIEINKETCRLLWTIPNFSSESIPLTFSRLIFPPLSNGAIRRSEQEARFAFASVIERSTKYFYSVETPTKELYNFTGQKDISAQTDLTLYTFENKFIEQARVEFKAKNPPQEHISKDIEKLVKEKTTGNWFYLLENIDSGTLSSLVEKFKLAFDG
ncbi:hypothetical protein [Thermosediminibacter litoriperuensis]|uniref:Uncharacterized protein n=1 Tax=Thermosediminibacter litoriperuensis TaxID=291989 RepID=A0A5S5AC33_9FIRM|nr:hypothetical protein [Thermosediminibacter litoriperuensis]TYP46777.1 hypothetical protein LZ11_02492 [Thermosediminibacter litoriperuensis]